MRDFYMTLLSNSSMEYYPKNKTSSFTVQLPRYIQMEDDWEVGLVEIQYPYTFYTVSEAHNEIELIVYDVTKAFSKFVHDNANTQARLRDSGLPSTKITCKLTPGFFSSIADLVSAIDELVRSSTDLRIIKYDSETNSIIIDNREVVMGGKCIDSCILSDRLNLQLGYTPGVNIITAPVQYIPNLNFGVPDKMIIYCDIVEPQLFGDKCAKVLFTVNTLPEGEPTFGRAISSYIHSPHYIQVQANNFEAVRIDIRDVQGNLMPFQYGTLTIKLHFRQK